MYKFFPLPDPVPDRDRRASYPGIVGFGMGYLTLRLRGSFFAIATLALAVVLQTLVVNWDYVGGSRGAYIIHDENLEIGGFQVHYIEYLFALMLMLAVIALITARTIERSQLGFGFATIRDDELAAEASGVPTLRLKLIATDALRRLHGHGRRAVSLLHRLSAAVVGLRPRIRGQLDRDADDRRHHAAGSGRWSAPCCSARRSNIATVTISSAVNLLIVGLMLVAFVIIAPNGMVGLVQERLRARRQP